MLKEEREQPRTSSSYVEGAGLKVQPRASGTVLMPFLRNHWHLIQGEKCLNAILVLLSAPCVPTTFSFSFLSSPKRGCNKRISSLLMSKVKQRPLEGHVMVTGRLYNSLSNLEQILGFQSATLWPRPALC